MINSFYKKRVLLIGLGDTGQSVLHFLTNQNCFIKAIDTRTNVEGLSEIKTKFKDVEFITGQMFHESIIKDIELIVISPGVSLKESYVVAALDKGIPVIGDIEIFAQIKEKNSKVIGITGSNGKTTVTSLVGELLEASGITTIVAGNIGIPILNTLDETAPEVYVLELSSYQLESTYSLDLETATILNISEDHMDRYSSIDEYAKAKYRIFNHAKKCILNRDDDYLKPLIKYDTITFGNHVDEKNYGIKKNGSQYFIAKGNVEIIAVEEIRLKGIHNIQNVMAALALCEPFNVSNNAIKKVLAEFEAPPHRMEYVDSISGIDFYNDSKGTNVGATIAAIKSMTKPILLVAGGDGKNQNFSPLMHVTKDKIKHVALIGADAEIMQKAFSAAAIPNHIEKSLEDAIHKSFELANKGDVVLLSPACASTDMFKNYVERGNLFKACVKKLKESHVR
ncbi:MAG TPA: UDP-N-acetylmuramoyl-L-alanine--D-glutamate ligase [Methylophilaceae bacterium]|jgi:UDP-N-acetylmuramoylalanine--D-glutamate ligase|nr:UDP-N-acetylmuramoyl-L-alanine--D-glutamate ligase [Methylophilaceae bacterium]HBO18191.1 UDP-N-acetylmuramoyl-L-alanine--D-glutamate ligase [Methylophilaceae bacterium]HCB68233.1 UDP-N-acetylmuramoyl-L-alanine--D-glutamate ligase [Methylophilaceae bacterium]HCC72467.1 UDP-N-acetylmuramoyl-L-alanine--D-glutamate ligase [Methylophilaceae bacterium]